MRTPPSPKKGGPVSAGPPIFDKDSPLEQAPERLRRRGGLERCLQFRVWGLGLRVSGSGLRVEG